MKILIADDHTLFRDILQTYANRLEKDYDIHHVTCLNEAASQLENTGLFFDLIILDLCMPGMNGFDGLRRIKAGRPEQPVAVISGVAQAWEVGQSIQNGAVAFFPKSMPGKALVHAIDLVMSGEKFVPLEYLAPPVHNVPHHLPIGAGFAEDKPMYHPHLTRRENDVLKYLIRGASNQEIAMGLNLQTVTVKLHVRSICKKLGAKNRTQAALYARDHHLFRTCF